MTDPLLAQAAQHWSRVVPTPARAHWWQSQRICGHINQRYCGVPAAGTHGGDIELLRRVSGGVRLERAVSVGCGLAFHELKLIEAGVVGHFTLFEISQARADQALASSRRMGLADRISVHVGEDAMADRPGAAYDLVYWKDALHHMFDARAAVQWSRRVLKPGGLLCQ